MGVCCIVFDIDGMLFEFFMKIRGGGGGWIYFYIFLDKTTLSDFTFYAIFNIKKIY